MIEIDDNDLINLCDYNMYRLDSTSRHTGGVCIYIRKHWSATVINKYVLNKDFWLLVLKLSYKNYKIILGVFYRAPRYLSLSADFFNYFRDLLNNISELNDQICICGDININWNTNDHDKNEIKNIINDCGFKQTINDYTRISKTSKTIIDYVIVSDTYNIKSEIKSELNISDHESIMITFNQPVKKVNKEKVVKTVKYDMESLRNRVCRSDLLTTYFLDCDANANIFSSNIINIMNEFVVYKKITINNISNQWFTNDLKQIKQSKINQYNVAKIINNNYEWSKYKTLRNKYKTSLNNAKSQLIKNKIQNSIDQKTMWANLKSYVLKKPKNEITEVMFGNNLIKNSKEIANEFNKYFLDSIKYILTIVLH